MANVKSIRAALTRLAAIVFGEPKRPAPVRVTAPKKR